MSASWTLVTGASGFIGGQLARLLVARGERVKAFVRPGANLKYLRELPADQLQLAYGDIMVDHTVYRALAGCDRMYHVASPFRMWAPDPDEVIRPAVEGTRAVLEAARRRSLERIVVTSSVAALGAEKRAEPMDEDHEFNLPDAEAYIRSKREADLVARDYAEAGLPIIIVYPSGVFGPGDWKPTPSGQSLLSYLRSPTWVRMPVPEGGISVADVEDVAQGHILAMDKGVIGGRYVLGGENLTYRQMIDLLSDLTGLAPAGGTASQGSVEALGWLMELGAELSGGEPQLTRRMARDYATAYTWVSSERAERELGYQYRPARETLRRAVRWFLANGYVKDRHARRLRLDLRFSS